MLEIFAELKRNAVKRDELLSELLTIPVTAAQWRHIVETMLGGDFKVTTFEPIPTELPRNFNLMSSIRKLLFSQFDVTFSASRIKATLKIPSSEEKSFYAALAKLAGTGQIFRVGRGLYAGRPRKTATKKR
ncbi:MAG: hypothetical protein WCB16_05195 [Candidatus Binatus sp.]